MATYRITYEERVRKTIDFDPATYDEAEAIFDDDMDLDGHQEIDFKCRRLRCDRVLDSVVAR